MGDLLDGYTPERAWDEMFVGPDEPRSHYQSLHQVLGTLSRDDFELRCAARDRAFHDQGITFSHSGEERPFPLDLVPRIIDAAEWAVVEAGVRQRVLALERFLADVYGPGEILADGVVPRRLVASSSHFHRCVAGLDPAGGVRVHVAGIDLVRDGAGSFRVLEDNLRTPSGISYVVENRRAMTHVFPELFASHRIRRVADYPPRLLEAFRATAPPGVDDPCVVVLTPGVHNAAYFEHSFLARQMGVELVEGRDLVCRDQRVYMRTTAGEQRVDVVYRRVDDEFLDPVHFRPDSVLGCAGILNAARAGNVTIANAPGNGVADDKADLPVRAGDDRVLPRRGADPGQRRDLPARGRRGVRVGARPPRRAGVQAGRRLGRQGHRDRAGGERDGARRPAGEGARRSARLDRAGAGRAVDRADVRRRPDGRPPPRPAPVRGERRARRVGRARRADAGRAPGEEPDRELQPGRRLEGHLGARGRRRATGARSHRRRAATAPPPPMPSAAPTLGPLPEQDSQQQQQQ